MRADFVHNFKNHCDNLADEEICLLAQGGNADALETLVFRYSRMIRASVRTMYIAGADQEDLMQEGMLGLWDAVRTYDQNRAKGFPQYAKRCIINRIYTAVKAANRLKHTPLNNYISLQGPLFDERADTGVPDFNPEAFVIDRENENELEKKLSGLLSVFEIKVLELFLEGLTYEEMSEILLKPRKSLENAIFRIRKKMAENISKR